jgi:hypothetical protein
LDVHRDFCEVAIAADGGVRSAGRVATRVAALEVFAQSLAPGDVVALEATAGSDRIVSILQRDGVRVVVANARRLRSIADAKAKTDRLDARALARLLVSGLLDEVWTPDERSRTLRRLTSRRERVVRARTRAKNGVPPVCWTPDHLRRCGAKGWCLCRRPDPRTRSSSVARRPSCCVPAARRASCLRASASRSRRSGIGGARTGSIVMSATTA